MSATTRRGRLSGVSAREVPPPARMSAAWHRLLRRCLKEAVALGATDPQVYIESESGILVMDGPAHAGNSDAPQHQNVLFRLPWPRDLKGHLDVGSW